MSTTVAELSIVIPCGPGEAAWPTLLDRLSMLDDAVEIILSGSEPEPSLAANRGARWITGAPGRAAQLNRGVEAASGTMLWLLHADSEPDAACLDAARRYSREGPGGIGWFDLSYAADGPAAVAVNAWGANLRSRWFGLPFGDQGWLLRKSLFKALGGFDPEFGRGEDLEFMVRAARAGVPRVRIGTSLRSSARRYRVHGWLRTTLEHLLLTARLHRRARRWGRSGIA
jgi:GT2 family glycosyltransferase